MFRPGTLAFRLTAFALVWIAGALVAGGLLLAALFEAQVQRGFEQQLDVLLETLVAVTEPAESSDTELRLIGQPGEPRFERPFSGWYWQISRNGTAQLTSRSLWDQMLPLPAERPAAGEDGARRYDIEGPRGQRLRVIERPIIFAAGAPGNNGGDTDTGTEYSYAVAGDLGELEAEIRPFRVTLAWSLGVLGLGLAAAVLIQVTLGLMPLRRLRTQLARIRAGRAPRIEGHYPGEVKPLVEDANALIAHIAEVVERARTHVGNLAHALRTPLSVLANEAERSDGPLAETVIRETRLMQERVEHHLARARTAASVGVIGQRTEVRPVLEALKRTLERMYPEQNLTIDVSTTLSDDLAFQGDAQDLEELLGNLMENACKWARTRVRVSVVRNGGQLAIAIEDDGPGMKPDDRARAIARGARLDESVPGSGLGLDIVSEIAALYGGRLRLGQSGLGGLHADLDLPAAVG